MPVEAKPLFRPDVLRPHLKEFPLPDRIETYREKMINWGKMIASSRIDGFKEEEILDDFINDFFYGVLGYARAVDTRPSVHDSAREVHSGRRQIRRRRDRRIPAGEQSVRRRRRREGAKGSVRAAFQRAKKIRR